MFDFTVEEEVFIESPAREVFAYIADAENDSEWCPAVLKIRQIEGDGPGQGAVYEMLHAPGGMKFEATTRIVAFEPNSLIRWVMTDSGHELHGTYRLEVVDDGTLLRQRSEFAFKGWMRIPGLLMKRFIVRDVHKELRKQFSNLKQLLEEEQRSGEAYPSLEAA
ncbi:MAG TPA: SRPBCC family protein [Candidatus Sulfomarinibacteraceae bacterium]|nr:SRPBCC family protein [Candidatus Sulfomarinibacteraceae bacterium]